MVSGTASRFPLRDSKQRRARSRYAKATAKPTPSYEGKGGRRNHLRHPHRIRVANFVVDRTVVLIEGMTVSRLDTREINDAFNRRSLRKPRVSGKAEKLSSLEAQEL